MTEEAQGRQRRRSKLWIVALALAILVSIIVIPPLVSINRYKSRIARAMSASLGRTVHMSGVELRILPRPGFVITDLTVEEDPAYGGEPVLHANEVTAAIRLLSLWRGRLEISRISVDEASLNLVRTSDGRWNLDTLFRTAAQSQPGTADRRQYPLPYLEATNSRINIKRGIEKLPYSLVNADISFWEENPGDWRVRVKAQPARTDVELPARRYRYRPAGRPDAPRSGIETHAGARRRGVAPGAARPAKPFASRLRSGLARRSGPLGEMKLDGTADSAQA